MQREGAASVVLAFALSLLAVVVTPRCSRDRVADPLRWVEGVRGSALLAAGDVVLVHPPWRDDVARALRRSGAVPASAVTTALSPRHGDPLPAMVVVTDGSAPLPRGLRAREGPREERDGIALVRLLARPPASSGGPRSLLDDLSRAHVELRPRDGGQHGVVACPWDLSRQRHSCAGMPQWLYVGVEQLPVGGETVRCAWAHPKSDNVLAIRFPRAHLLDTLTLSLALTDGAASNTAAAAVDALVRIDGVESARLTKRPGARGFVVTRIEVPGAPKDADVDIEISAADDGQRHACFQLHTSSER